MCLAEQPTLTVFWCPCAALALFMGFALSYSRWRRGFKQQSRLVSRLAASQVGPPGVSVPGPPCSPGFCETSLVCPQAFLPLFAQRTALLAQRTAARGNRAQARTADSPRCRAAAPFWLQNGTNSKDGEVAAAALAAMARSTQKTELQLLGTFAGIKWRRVQVRELGRAGASLCSQRCSVWPYPSWRGAH